MATFNSMPGLSTSTSSNDHMAINLGTAQAQSLNMDVFDQELQFDESLLDGTALQNLPFTPGYDLDAFSTTFEDPFSYSSRHYEPPPNQDTLHEESSPQELDNKLLGFSAPVSSATVIDESGQFAETHMTAELYGMFFVAEDVFGGETTGRPLELTCYRRNLWQCSGQITLPRGITNIVNEQGNHIQVFEIIATITATESNEGKPAEIISIPWKNANAQPSDESKSIGPPPNVTLDLASGQEIDAHRLTLPVSWKRLQFKHATANNGRRKGLQQHFIVKIGLHGKTQNGELIKISEIQSGPVIVRGRSPRNFDSKKDVPLTSDKRMDRRSTGSTEGSGIRVERETSQGFMSNYPSLGGIQQSNDWSTPQTIPQGIPSPQPSPNPHPAKRMALSPNIPKPPVPAWSEPSKQPIAQHKPAHRQSTSAPINLSLSEDERSDNRSSSDLQSPQPGKSVPVVGQNAENSPQEDDMDPLYEYFPLTVDDWMPPVDAIYRPHIVHHTIVPPEMKAQQIKNKAKRYFAAD
ncbi:acid phosphatase [Mariannaea sp. PMI_226]|nr:acid phosphatase [Mariannaea sp. PMI_226]